MTFGVVYINAGEGNPVHYHPNCEELIYVLSGECDHSLGDEVIPLKPGMMLRIPPQYQAQCRQHRLATRDNDYLLFGC